MPEKILLENGAIAFIPAPSEMTAEQRLSLLDPSVHTLEDYKATKLAALNESCNQTILGGFLSNALGTEHFYGFTEQDQANLTGMLAMLNADPSVQEVLWKTEDVGPASHTRDQFLTLCKDALDFKNVHIARYWELKQEISRATSIEGIEAIQWR